MILISNPAALTIPGKLPFELQCLILKNLLLNYFSFSQDAHQDPEGLDRMRIPDMLAQFVSLCGHNNMIDGVLSIVIEESEFDAVIFNSPHFGQLVSFILAKSIKLRLLKLRFMNLLNLSDRQQLKQNVFSLMEFGCHEISAEKEFSQISQSNVLDHIGYLKFVTSLKLGNQEMRIFYNAGSFRHFRRLIHLSLVITNFQDVSFLNHIMSDLRNWFFASLSSTTTTTTTSTSSENRKRLSLISRIEDTDVPAEVHINQVRLLSELLVQNKDLNIELDISPYVLIPPSVWNCYSELVARHGKVKTLTIKLSQEYTEFGWMNNIPGLRNLTIKLDPLDDIPDTNNLIEISNCSVVNLMFSSNWPQTSIYFSGLSNTLKRIYLQNCTLTADFFITLPDSVELLSFYMVCLEKTFDSIRLPTSLNTLPMEYPLKQSRVSS
ncbi:unnamed protein product [Ambrosiozyma monospora]|uniref:Unnamed protein product n=1 Tax=Ambrosiozyma monospora TaxID=43982 RepID=A0ACB5T474_AMBMO|nr:unnamed protein product [Ambrosiozyma monospora]